MSEIWNPGVDDRSSPEGSFAGDDALPALHDHDRSFPSLFDVKVQVRVEGVYLAYA